MSNWIKVTDRMPEEHETMFAKWYGTNKWHPAMFRALSQEVLITYEVKVNKPTPSVETRVCTAKTIDGEWRSEEIRNLELSGLVCKVISWMPFPEPDDLEHKEDSLDTISKHGFILIHVSSDNSISVSKYNTHDEAYDSMKLDFNNLIDDDCEDYYIETNSAYINYDERDIQFYWEIFDLDKI